MSDSASHKSRIDNFLLLSYFERHVTKKREKRICKHLLQASRFRLVLLRGHATRCYAVNQCCVYPVTTTKRPAKTDARGLKLLFTWKHNPSYLGPQNPRLGLKLGSSWNQRNFLWFSWFEMEVVCRSIKRGPNWAPHGSLCLAIVFANYNCGLFHCWQQPIHLLGKTP